MSGSLPNIGAALGGATARMSFNALRVPPIQFQSFVGLPPRLHTSDMLSGCGAVQLPPVQQAIGQLIRNNAAFVPSIANSVVNQINAGIFMVTSQVNALIGMATQSLTFGVAQLTSAAANYVDHTLVGSVNGFISSVTGSVNGHIAQIAGLNSSLAGSSINSAYSAVNGIVTSMPSTASLISKCGVLHASIGLPPLPSLNSIFDPIVNGGLNTVLGPVLGTVNGIQGAVQGTITAAQNAIFASVQSVVGAAESAVIGAISAATSAIGAAVSSVTSAVSSVTSAFTAAVTSVIDQVDAMVGQISGAISSAISTLVHTAEAAALSVICAAEHDFTSFINSIASPALQAALPPPM